MLLKEHGWMQLSSFFFCPYKAEIGKPMVGTSKGAPSDWGEGPGGWEVGLSLTEISVFPQVVSEAMQQQHEML